MTAIKITKDWIATIPKWKNTMIWTLQPMPGCELHRTLTTRISEWKFSSRWAKRTVKWMPHKCHLPLLVSTLAIYKLIRMEFRTRKTRTLWLRASSHSQLTLSCHPICNWLPLRLITRATICALVVSISWDPCAAKIPVDWQTCYVRLDLRVSRLSSRLTQGIVRLCSTWVCQASPRTAFSDSLERHWRANFLSQSSSFLSMSLGSKTKGN